MQLKSTCHECLPQRVGGKGICEGKEIGEWFSYRARQLFENRSHRAALSLANSPLRTTFFAQQIQHEMQQKCATEKWLLASEC